MTSIYTLNLNESNPELAALQSIPYDSKLNEIPNGVLQGDLHFHLFEAYKAVTNVETPSDPEEALAQLNEFNDKVTLVVKATNGAFERQYSPAIYSQDGQRLVIKWGQDVIPLCFTKNGIKLADAEGKPIVNQEGYDCEFEFQDVPAVRGAQGATDLAVEMSFLTPAIPAGAIMILRCHLVDFKIKRQALNASLKTKKYQEVIDSFTDLGSLGGGNDFQGETIKMGDLPGIGTYKVIGVREAGNFGKHIMQIAPPTDDELANGKYTVTLDDFYQVWTNDATSTTLRGTSAEISKDKPALLVVHSITPGDRGNRVKSGLIVHRDTSAPQKSGSIDLSKLATFRK